MTTPIANFYLEWRERRRHVYALREQPDHPSERLLQAIWHHQRLRRDDLRLTDGRSLRILHPGFLNREAGPDFREAVIQIEQDSPKRGDIEVDLHSRCWHQHGHDSNVAFGQVLLHVVWERETVTKIPTLVIRQCLDAPLDELSCWLGTEAAETYPEDLLGRCAAPLARLPEDRLRELLRQASLARLQRKALDLAARARQAGWEQALWEGMLRALGYKHNAWPMLRIGELRPALRAQPPESVLHCQARLFGVSGLLPSDVARTRAADGYVRRIWDCWWRERDGYGDLLLPAELWRLHGLRPANHPLRRLAVAAHWWMSPDLPLRLDRWFATPKDDRALPKSLVEALQTPEDEYWSHHWTLGGRHLAKPQPLVAPGRITDLAVNVVLPWFWARAFHGNNAALLAEAERRYLAWPAAQDNSVLRLARQRLTGGAVWKGANSAAMQQGLLQIVRDFCDHSDSLCSDCAFPDWVKTLGSAEATNHG